ncbi:alanine transaminase, partial [Bonamia ostreae]
MSIGAYTHSQGLPSVRNSVANYLTNRDNFKSNPENIFLSNGATQVIKMALQLLISSENDGIMVPIPQYPLYSASIQMFGGNFIG